MTNRPDDRKQDDTTTDEIEHEEEGLPLGVVDVTLLRLAYYDKCHVREDLQQPHPHIKVTINMNRIVWGL